MTVVGYLELAQTAVIALAVVLALAAWLKVGGYMRQCRCTVQAYASLVDTHPHRAVPAEDDGERTQEHDPIVDDAQCCDGHRPGLAGSCCDPDDCAPCCPECPTYCPALRSAPGSLAQRPDFEVFEHPSGRHARVDIPDAGTTSVMPSAGELTVPRYYFDDLARGEAR